MYADYTFYKDSYFGNIISESDFPRYEDKASDNLYYLTMGKIDLFLVENASGKLVLDDGKIPNAIKKSVCKIAEVLYDIEQSEIAYRKGVKQSQSTGLSTGGAVASVTSGSESVTYFNTATKSSAEIGNIVNSDVKSQDKYIFESIKMYLGGTGLLSQAL